MFNNDQDFQFDFIKSFTPLTTKKAILIIIFVGILVFFNMLFNGFVWDDMQYVLPSVATYGLNLIKLFSPNIFNSYGYYRPIPALYFSLIYSLFGYTTFFYHLLQLLLHIVNSSLIFVLFKKFFNKNIAFLLSLLFLIHPMQVESVSYIAQTASVLFFFFGIVALLLSQEKKPSKINIVITFMSLLLSLLTKEAGIAFLLIILLYRYLFKKGKLLQYSLLILFVIITYMGIRFLIGHTFFYHMVFVPISQLPFGIRLINIPAILFYYLKTFVFPVNLAIMQNWVVTKFTITDFYLPLILLIMVSIFLTLIGKIVYQKKDLFTTYLFFCLWFILGISFSLQIIPIDQTVSDRWFYFPIVGLLGMLGIIIQAIFLKKSHLNRTTYFFFIFVIVLLSVRTIVRNIDWQDYVTLYAHDAQIVDSYNIEANIAGEYLAKKDYDPALIHLKKSVAMHPSDQTVSQIGYIYERIGDLRQARIFYFKSLTTETYVSSQEHALFVYQNISRYLLYFDKNPLLAKTYITKGLREYPNDITLWVLLIQDESELKNHSDELLAAQKAYELLPTSQIGALYKLAIHNSPISIPLWTFYSQ